MVERQNVVTKVSLIALMPLLLLSAVYLKDSTDQNVHKMKMAQTTVQNCRWSSRMVDVLSGLTKEQLKQVAGLSSTKSVNCNSLTSAVYAQRDKNIASGLYLPN